MTDVSIPDSLSPTIKRFDAQKWKLDPKTGVRMYEYPIDSGQWKTAIQIKQELEKELANINRRTDNDIVRAWNFQGRNVHYDPLTGSTDIADAPLNDSEYSRIREWDDDYAQKLHDQYLENMGAIWALVNGPSFTKWFERVREGMDTTGMTLAEKEKQAREHKLLQERYQKAHESTEWIKLPCNHEIAPFGPTVERYVWDLKNRPKQGEFGCAICGFPMKRAELVKVLKRDLK